MPEDILNAKTGSSFIDACINDLVQTGYLHNHIRMYLASYVVHFRKTKWQAGAHWFLEHLLDGDEASNNFSWQWVASTFSNKPYIFNLENADEIIEEKPFVNIGSGYEFHRFFKYWNKAKNTAFLINANIENE
jgi:deoxyribodipyrimidine photo-lyase